MRACRLCGKEFRPTQRAVKHGNHFVHPLCRDAIGMSDRQRAHATIILDPPVEFPFRRIRQKEQRNDH